MSEKEINDLIRRGGLANDEAAEPVNEPEAVKAEKNRRKKMLIKFGAMGVLAVIILVFATI